VTGYFNNNYDNPAAYTWSGAIAPPNTCVAGDVSFAWREATIRRINFYRRLVGLPLTVLDNSNNRNTHSQESAMIMSANADLNHNPPLTWDCYTANGANAAANSNLALGNRGPDAIDGYINDAGTGNAAAGHRRWILYPPTTAFATGDVGDHNYQGPTDVGAYANNLWVFGNTGTRPASPTYVTWPHAGFVPYQLLPSSRRWSLSVPGGNFASVTIAATSGSTTYTVVQEPLASGSGDPAVVFRLTDVPLGRPDADIPIDFGRLMALEQLRRRTMCRLRHLEILSYRCRVRYPP